MIADIEKYCVAYMVPICVLDTGKYMFVQLSYESGLLFGEYILDSLIWAMAIRGCGRVTR